MHLNSLRTPFIYVDAARLRANIRAMAERAAAAGVRLRPHAKTHKSVEIAKWQVEAGAVGVCCAKLGEAEVLAAGGIGALRNFEPVFADVAFCPTGGLAMDDFRDYLALSNVVAAGGTWMMPANLVKSGDWAGVTRLAKQAAS